MSAILITGGTGTFGRAMVRACLADSRWSRVIVFSRDEVKQAQMFEDFGHIAPLKLFLGDVRDQRRLEMAMSGVDVVVHAAALKRVDAGAYSPSETILTNVVGTMNVVNAAINVGVGKVIVISSDKAVNATNIYGATKFCTSPTTRVLMADLTWKMAADVVVGDRIIGVDEHVPGPNEWRKLQPSTITKSHHFTGPTVRVKTSRAPVDVSVDHPFLARLPQTGANFQWVEAKDLRDGMIIKDIGEPWEDRSDSWLAGIIDGEGSLSITDTNCRVVIGQNDGPVLDRILVELRKAKIDHKVNVSASDKCVRVTIGRINNVLRLLGMFRPSRMIGRIDELLARGYAPGGAKHDATVESITLLPNGDLVGLTTTTGTLITDGLVSHNCAETYAVQANSYGYPRGTRIAACRYGNILGSRGSVIYRWREQVAREMPITVTDPRMSRFIMTIEQAVELVNFTLDSMLGGEVVLPVLPSAMMTTLAEAVAPDGWPRFTSGLRPGGEKLAESLLNEEEPTRTRRCGNYYLVLPSHHDWTEGKGWERTGDFVACDMTYRSDNADNRWLTVSDLRELVAQTQAFR